MKRLYASRAISRAKVHLRAIQIDLLPVQAEQFAGSDINEKEGDDVWSQACRTCLDEPVGLLSCNFASMGAYLNGALYPPVVAKAPLRRTLQRRTRGRMYLTILCARFGSGAQRLRRVVDSLLVDAGKRPIAEMLD